LISLKKSKYPVCYSGTFSFGSFRIKLRKELNSRFEDPRCFEAWKRAKKYQGAKMEGIQAKSRSHKKWTIGFFLKR
jgi:hypothetical protein